MRLLGIAGITALLSMTLTTPAQAAGVPELWSTDPFFAQKAIRAGDVNGDGTDDLVGFNPYPNGFQVRLSNGSTFEPQQHWGYNTSYADTANYPYAIFVGDMDNDGRADAVMVRLPSPRGIWVARSEVDHFAPYPVRYLDNSIVGDLATMSADIDGDGDTDVVGLYSDFVLAARSDGTATLPLTAWGWEITYGEKASLAADVTGDGAADFVLVDTTGVRVIPANPQWRDTPEQWTTTPFHGTKKTLTGDIDADGDADLIAVNDTDVQVMRSTGTSFSAPEQWYSGSFLGTRDTLVADVDGDDDADLVAVNDTDIWVLRTQ